MELEPFYNGRKFIDYERHFKPIMLEYIEKKNWTKDQAWDILGEYVAKGGGTVSHFTQFLENHA